MCDVNCCEYMSKKSYGATQGNCFKKQKQNQSFFTKEVVNGKTNRSTIGEEILETSSVGVLINKFNSAHTIKINKLLDQVVIYEQGYSKNSFDRYFKKQRKQHFSYQKKNCQIKEFFINKNILKTPLTDFLLTKQNQQLSYQRRNKLPVQQVNYNQRHSRHFFGKYLKCKNQQFSYQSSDELPV